MGRTVHCDGCGAREAPHRVPWAPHLDYCNDCHQKIESYMQEVHELHTEMVKDWNEKLSELKSRMREKLPDGELPL